MDLLVAGRGEVEPISAHRAGRVDVAREGSDQHHPLRRQLPQAVEHPVPGIGEVFEHDVIRPPEALDSPDELGSEVEVAQPRQADATHQGEARRRFGGGHSSVQPQELTSRTITPLPVSMWVVQGMHGSKLRMVRRMSMPLTSSSATLSRIGVSTMACS